MVYVNCENMTQWYYPKNFPTFLVKNFATYFVVLVETITRM